MIFAAFKPYVYGVVCVRVLGGYRDTQIFLRGWIWKKKKGRKRKKKETKTRLAKEKDKQSIERRVAISSLKQQTGRIIV